VVVFPQYRANVEAVETARAAGEPLTDADFVDHKSSVTEQFADYDPKHLAAMSVTAMIKTVAQMKNARRGHDAQGRVKKVNLDSSAEGYSNFMAPMRITRISNQVKTIKENTDAIYTDDILRPATDTYLTAEWDEFVPFPNTWKIRFDGFGKSDYSGGSSSGSKDKGKDKDKKKHPFGLLRQAKIDADALAAPPFYQPQGASHFGGSFADVACVCTTSGKECQCREKAKTKDVDKDEVLKAKLPAELEASISTGCGVGK
jgi:hypothetical protein